MAKRLIKFIIGICLIFIAICISIIQHSSYANVIKTNWNIDIPQYYTEIYHFSPQSFHGDGTRYSVLQYDQDISSSFDFKPITSSYKDIVYHLIGQTEQVTPKDMYPSCYNQLIYIQEKESDTLYIIYDSNDFKLYVIEEFI